MVQVPVWNQELNSRGHSGRAQHKRQTVRLDFIWFNFAPSTLQTLNFNRH